MQNIYSQIKIVLFFTIVIIASCITFNNQKNIDTYKYTNEILASNINFWGKATIHQLKISDNKKTALLLLLTKEKLEYIVSNENGHYNRYKYSKVNDTTHLLVSQPNKIPFLSRSENSYIDSILFTPSLCIEKSIPVRNNNRYEASLVRFLTIYTKDNQNIYKNYYESKNKTDSSINLSAIPLKNIPIYFSSLQNPSIKENTKLVETYPITINDGLTTMDIFFRKYIMRY